MLDKLISLTHSYDFEEYGTFNLVGARIKANVLTLTFDFHIRADKDEYQSWEVECVGLLEHQMFLREFESFDLSRDHPCSGHISTRRLPSLLQRSGGASGSC
jgi:hypothetical protein